MWHPLGSQRIDLQGKNLREETNDINQSSDFEERRRNFCHRSMRKNSPLVAFTTSFKTSVDTEVSILIYAQRSISFKCVTDF